MYATYMLKNKMHEFCACSEDYLFPQLYLVKQQPPDTVKLMTKASYNIYMIDWQRFCRLVHLGLIVKHHSYSLTCDGKLLKMNLEVCDHVMAVLLSLKHFNPMHEAIRRIVNRIAVFGKKQSMNFSEVS